MNKIWEKARNVAMSAMPSTVAPGNQYAQSYAAALCLLVSADMRFDMEEFQQAARFMESDTTLTEEKLTAQAASYFRGYTESIKAVMSYDNMDFPTVQTELIMEVRNVTDEYRPALIRMLTVLHGVSDADERAIIDRINM